MNKKRNGSSASLARLVIVENGYHQSSFGSVVAITFAVRALPPLKVVVLDHVQVFQHNISFNNSIVILDLDSMHKLDAINLAFQIRKLNRETAIMFMAASPNPVFVREGMLSALSENAFWLKGPARDAQAALREIMSAYRGEMLEDFQFIEPMISETSYFGLLSPHQHRVMHLMALGDSNSEIAKKCQITAKAAERTISKASKLLGVTVGSSVNNHRVLAANKYLFALFNIDSWVCRKNITSG